MAVNAPLSLTLSPSDGAREKNIVRRRLSCPLAPSDGERGAFTLLLGRNCIVQTACEFERFGTYGCAADCKSAIQQSETLRCDRERLEHEYHFEYL